MKKIMPVIATTTLIPLSLIAFSTTSNAAVGDNLEGWKLDSCSSEASDVGVELVGSAQLKSESETQIVELGNDAAVKVERYGFENGANCELIYLDGAPVDGAALNSGVLTHQEFKANKFNDDVIDVIPEVETTSTVAAWTGGEVLMNAHVTSAPTVESMWFESEIPGEWEEVVFSSGTSVTNWSLDLEGAVTVKGEPGVPAVEGECTDKPKGKEKGHHKGKAKGKAKGHYKVNHKGKAKGHYKDKAKGKAKGHKKNTECTVGTPEVPGTPDVVTPFTASYSGSTQY